MTEISICGRAFHIDGRPTYPGRTFEGHKIEGLLFNVRAVQATFDDANPETRKWWAYPDTGVWDPERNVEEFCAALPAWKAHGILGFSINFQGGGPMYVREIYQEYDNNGFTLQGEIKPAYADRISRVLKRADELGMVAIVGFFYWVILRRMQDEAAMWRAADEAAAFLEGTGCRNVLVEVANEIDVVVKRTEIDLFRQERQAEMIEKLRSAHPGLLYSTSYNVRNVKPGEGKSPYPLIEAVDYVLLHGNKSRPDTLEAGLQAVEIIPAFSANPKPIVINEDAPAVPQLDAAWRNYTSWGYYDQGFAGQAESGNPYARYEDRVRWKDGPIEDLSGFQTVPVNWGINTPFKCDFFNRVAEVTGSPGV